MKPPSHSATSSRLLAAGLLAAAATGFPGEAAAQESLLDRLSVHGHLSQAYGMTDKHQYLGIPSEGTADYRTAALQFRFQATDRDAMVIQLSHERLGLSPLMGVEPSVDLDWVFYERRLNDATRLRVGKIVMPMGIYNEIRDVGVLLPLYRAPPLMYSERMYAVETLSGASLHGEKWLGQDWRLSADVFGGEWEYMQLDLETMGRARNGLGSQVWLWTPVQGLRVGASALRFTASNVMGMPEDYEEPQKTFGAALDATFERIFVRSELRHSRFEIGTAEGYYGEVGVPLGRGFSLVAQAEFADFNWDLSSFFPPGMPFPVTFDGNVARDQALALRWAPSPSLVFKLEGHRHRGYLTEDPLLNFLVDPPARFNYGILSVSTSF